MSSVVVSQRDRIGVAAAEGGQHPPGPVVGERVAVGHRAAGRVGRRAVSAAQQLPAQIVGKRAGIPLLVGLHPDSPRRVVTELDDPVAGRLHRRDTGMASRNASTSILPCIRHTPIQVSLRNCVHEV